MKTSVLLVASLAVVAAISFAHAQTQARERSRLQRQIEVLSRTRQLAEFGQKTLRPPLQEKREYIHQRLNELREQLRQEADRPESVSEEQELREFVAALLFRVIDLERRVRKLENPEPRITLTR